MIVGTEVVVVCRSVDVVEEGIDSGKALGVAGSIGSKLELGWELDFVEWPLVIVGAEVVVVYVAVGVVEEGIDSGKALGVAGSIGSKLELAGISLCKNLIGEGHLWLLVKLPKKFSLRNELMLSIMLLFVSIRLVVLFESDIEACGVCSRQGVRDSVGRTCSGLALSV